MKKQHIAAAACLVAGAIGFAAVYSTKIVNKDRGFTISIYQSQNSSQIKSFNFATAIPSSYFSILSVTS